MFTRVIGISLIALTLYGASASATYGAEITTPAPIEERTMLLAKLDSLVKLLTALQLQLTQTAAVMTAEATVPVAAPDVPPSPAAF